MSDKKVSEGAALWHGRFDVAPADDLMAYTESLSFDQRLWRDDIVGSHAQLVLRRQTSYVASWQSGSQK